MPRKSSVPPQRPARDEDANRRSGQTAGGGGGGDDGTGGGRTGFGDPGGREFPDWVPFRRDDIAELGEWDEEHFRGTGHSGGGHRHDSRVPRATKFPVAVDSLADLQEVHDAVLANYAMVRLDEVHQSYVFRGLVNIGSNRVIADVAVDRWGTPRTVHPVNGDEVRRNDADGRDGGLVPLDLRFLNAWEPDEG